VVAESKLNKWR